MTPEELKQDKGFMEASPADQHAYLMSVDPEYAKAPASDQAGYRQHLKLDYAKSNVAKYPENQPHQPTLMERAAQSLEPKEGEGAGTRTLKGFGRAAMAVPGIASAMVSPATDEEKRAGYDDPLAYLGPLQAHRLIEQPSAQARQHVDEMARRQEQTAAAQGKQAPTSAKIAEYGGKALASVPVLGPMALGMGERAAKGDVAGTLAETGAYAVAPEAGKGIAKAIPGMARGAAEGLVKPLVKAPIGMAAENLKFGRNPAAGIVNEGLVGTRESLIPKTQAKIAELGEAADATLKHHPNHNVEIDAEPHIDAAINNGIQSAEMTGNRGAVNRLEDLRQALKTKYGATKGTPFEMNQLKRKVGDVASDLGAFKATDPLESSAAAALHDLYGRLKGDVNKAVPEVGPLNERTADLIGARMALKRNALMQTGRPVIDSHSTLTGLTGKALQSTVTSAPVRTGLAKMLSFGQRAETPEPSFPPVSGGSHGADTEPLERRQYVRPIMTGEPGEPARPQPAAEPAPYERRTSEQTRSDIMNNGDPAMADLDKLQRGRINELRQRYPISNYPPTLQPYGEGLVSPPEENAPDSFYRKYGQR